MFTAFVEAGQARELVDSSGGRTQTASELSSSGDGTLEHFAGDGLLVFFNDPRSRSPTTSRRR